MARISKSALTIFLVMGCIILFGGLKFLKSQNTTAVPMAKLPQRAKGNPQASIKVIEFIDFQCPACAHGAKLLHEYFDKYPGRFYLELRYYPLAMHSHGMLSARWGECAARQEKFWPFFDLLIDRQMEWSVMTDPVPSFEAVAKQAGLNQGKANACLQDSSVDQTIQTDVEEGKLRAVSSTPSYFINDEMLVGVKSLKMKLDGLLGIKADPQPVSPSPVPAQKP